MRTTTFALFLGTLLALPVGAEDIKTAMIRAIDAGELTVVIDDATAQIWQQRTGSRDPVKARITPIRSFQQEGCRRFQVVLYQDNVETRSGDKARLDFRFEMNLCRDGSPPLEGVSPELMKKLMEEGRRQGSVNHPRLKAEACEGASCIKPD